MTSPKRKTKQKKLVCKSVEDYEAKCCCGMKFTVYDDFIAHGCNGKPKDMDPYGKNYVDKCDVCGALPTVEITGMCGPCTWGEAETINGNW